MVFNLFLVFNCAIFPNRNLVEMILPQGLEQWYMVNFFIATWMDSIIESIRFSGMVNSEFTRFIFIPSQISFFCGGLSEFELNCF